jgi:hypothetical protein
VRNALMILAIIAGLALISATVLLIALFHGYFDHGQFEIKQVQWSSANQAAMVAECFDQEAMSSYIYFVLIGDHVFTPTELRNAYHSSAVIFAAADGCLNLRWQSAAKLVIVCNGHSVSQQHINVQESQSGGIAIVYENIPHK